LLMLEKNYVNLVVKRLCYLFRRHPESSLFFLPSS